MSALAMSDSLPAPDELTRFQWDLLRAVEQGHGESIGLDIKHTIEGYYDTDINHGRLYPNLDELVDYGLITKSERDKRSNFYGLTEDGRAALQTRRDWIGATSLDGGKNE